MKLTSIHLQNYRAHEDLRVEFNPGFNLVVGINGSGKTSLLKGISEVLNIPISNLAHKSFRILNESYYAHTKVMQFDRRYRFEPQFPVCAEVTGNDSLGEFSFSIRKNMDGPNYDIEGQQPMLMSIDMREESNNQSRQKSIIFPLVAFYRANRKWVAETNQIQIMQAATEKTSRHDGYQEWWDAAINVVALQHWVIGKCLERYQYSSESGKLFHQIDNDELALVNMALVVAVDGIKSLRYDMPQKSILVDWQPNGETQKTISFDHLSDGQRAVICLVADIARRICILNPQLGKDVIRKTPGVVLIDELDVHLHPHWQRRIVNGLKKAFPEIQFIATSHSPQILGELRPEEIILLREDGTSRPQVSYGLDSSQVLKEIMETSARNQDVDKNLGKLFLEIENNQISEAKQRLDTLRKESPQIPELGQAEALIRRKEIIGR